MTVLARLTVTLAFGRRLLHDQLTTNTPLLTADADDHRLITPSGAELHVRRQPTPPTTSRSTHRVIGSSPIRGATPQLSGL
jgi:hypothetical protein